MRSSLFAAASLVFAIGCAAPPVHGDHHALRPVSGRVLTSASMPAVRIEFGEGFRYVGGQDFVLYEVANAEQHFFVDAGADGRIKRLYWVQFEGYLPTNTHSYDYDSPTKVDIGGLEFVADAFPANVASNEGRPDSDGAHARAFLTAKGLKMASDDVIMQRLVHLVDKEKRNELMIIYAEALNGTPAAEATKGLLDRAVKGLKITR
jgi:hypothetical protein